MLKKKIISLMILIIVTVALNTELYSQNNAGDMAGRSADMLHRRLDLSDDQYHKVYSILHDYYINRTSNSDSKSWDAAKISIGNILTKDQLSTFSSMNDSSILNSGNSRRNRGRTDDSDSDDNNSDKSRDDDSRKSRNDNSNRDKSRDDGSRNDSNDDNDDSRENDSRDDDSRKSGRDKN